MSLRFLNYFYFFSAVLILVTKIVINSSVDVGRSMFDVHLLIGSSSKTDMSRFGRRRNNPEYWDLRDGYRPM